MSSSFCYPICRNWMIKQIFNHWTKNEFLNEKLQMLPFNSIQVTSATTCIELNDLHLQFAIQTIPALFQKIEPYNFSSDSFNLISIKKTFVYFSKYEMCFVCHLIYTKLYRIPILYYWYLVMYSASGPR